MRASLVNAKLTSYPFQHFTSTSRRRRRRRIVVSQSSQSPSEAPTKRLSDARKSQVSQFGIRTFALHPTQASWLLQLHLCKALVNALFASYKTIILV